MHRLKNEKIRIGIIGLGYVGLPLAVEFGKVFKTVGFDIDCSRVQRLNNFEDETKEISKEELQNSKLLNITSEDKELDDCNFYIVTVPTPITKQKKPDLNPILNASKLISKKLKTDDIVVYESTVYPGCIEEDCVPVLEQHSKLKFNKDFFCGYSPERINPGDKKHRLPDIVKITSGSNPSVAEYVDSVYKEIITAGTFCASSIKVAEAAKVIENTQRDLNIALVNEFSKIFNNLELDTNEILEAAGSKWNFLNFKPGLVGGHCIGIDPYYLTYKSSKEGYVPELVLSGRKLNDSMHDYVCNQILKHLKTKGINNEGSKALILGLTFKENCPDLRNSRVFDLVESLKRKKISVDVYDPWVEVENLSINKINDINSHEGLYDFVVIAVAHDIFKSLKKEDFKKICKKDYLIYDLKNSIKKDENVFKL